MRPNFIEYAESIMASRTEYDLLLEKLVIALAPTYFTEDLSAEAIVSGAQEIREELYAMKENYFSEYPKQRLPKSN
jgi:hypothetical protein